MDRGQFHESICMIDVETYKRFMGITSVPQFAIEYFEPELEQKYTSVAQAVYDQRTDIHRLRLPSGYEVPRFLLYHELTHICDMRMFKKGEKTHDFCLAGFMEYHASQIELMVLMGAAHFDDHILFSMSDCSNYLGWTVQQYLENKLTTAVDLICEKDQRFRIMGLDAFFNFLGLKSICSMYALDFVDTFNYRPFADRLPTSLLFEIRKDLVGWIENVEKVVALYSRTVGYIV